MPYLETGVGYQKTDTSHNAAKTTPAKVTRAKVLACFRHRRVMGQGPITTEDISLYLGIHYRSVQPRISELRSSGEVVDSGLRGLSIFGKSVIQWEYSRKTPAVT